MDDTALVSALDRKNSDWTYYSDAWQMLNILYEGGVKMQRNVDKFLIRRPKELYDVFYERTRRLTYQDILQSCISWHLSKMFQRDPDIKLKDGGAPDLENFLDNCDNCGTSFINYSRNILETMMLYRSAFVLVDKPRPDGSMPLITRQDVIESGANKPYLVTFDPRHVINWGKDSYGNLNWVVIKTITQTQESALSAIETNIDWWIFDRENFYQYRFQIDKKEMNVDMNSLLLSDGGKIVGTTVSSIARLVDSGPHVLSEFKQVPVRHCKLPLDLWHAHRAFLHLLEHVDTMNGYSWKLFMCNLPQLCIFSEEEVTGQTLSETGFLKFGKDDKAEWLEPDTASFQESRIHLQSTRQEIYRAFHLQAQAKESTATADGASGYSKEVEMMPAVDVLNALGNILRTETQNVLCDVKKSVDLPTEKDDRPDISGYDQEIRPTLRDIEKFQTANDSGILAKSETLERVLANDIAMDILSGKNQDIKDAVNKEIFASKSNLDLEEDSLRLQAELQLKAAKPVGAEGAQKGEFKSRQARSSALGTIRSEQQSNAQPG